MSLISRNGRGELPEAVQRPGGAFVEDVHPDAEQLLQLEVQARQVEQRGVVVEGDDQVEARAHGGAEDTRA